MKMNTPTKPIDQRIKKLWVEALRSGDYRQGERALRRLEKDGDTFCCLGVLCEIAVKEGILEEPYPYIEDDKPAVGMAYSYKAKKGLPRSGFLPDEVREWLGINDITMWVSRDNDLVAIDHLNDMLYTFEEIADIIEREL